MKASDIEKFECMFNPSSVAVIGATNALGKWGFDLMWVLLRSRNSNRRRIYPVNLTETEVHGIKAYPRVTEIPEPVDLAIIVVPAAHVVSVMKDCVDKGVKSAVVITAGFAELGEEGMKIQRELVDVARSGGIRFIGPNTMGHFSTGSGFNSVSIVDDIGEKGRIGLISQSGNIGIYNVMRGLEDGISFSKFIGTGNEADITLEDCLEYLGQDEETKVIAMYVEGLRKGRRFFELAREITRKKPIVAIKVGRTEAGTKAARSHTSALSGSDTIYDAVFKQCGVIRVDELAELFGTAAALAYQPMMTGNRVGIVTRGGGFGVLASDACQARGLVIPALSSHTMDQLNEVLPPYWSHGNPVDMVASSAYAYHCIKAVMSDDNIDAVYYLSVTDFNPSFNMDKLVCVPPANQPEARRMIEEYNREQADGIAAAAKGMSEYRKPIIFCAVTPNRKLWTSEMYFRLRDNGALIYPAPEDGAKILARLAEYGRYRQGVEIGEGEHISQQVEEYSYEQ